MRAGAAAVLALVAAVFGILTLLGFAGGLWWVADLAAHFRVQYALILGVVALGTALLRRHAVAGTALVLALANLVVVVPLWHRGPPQASGPALTIVVLNLDATNDDHEAVAQLVGERQPDVFAVLELTPAWRTALDEPLGAYGERVLAAREGSYGLGLFSRLPLSGSEILTPAGPDDPVLASTIAAPFGPLRVAVLHPRVPASSADEGGHLALLRAAGDVASEADSEGAVLGDLNTTPWSARFEKLTGAAGLRDTREGYGLQATWPSFLPRVLRIPIDHVLVTPGLAAIERKVGPAVGSDHLPVFVELATRS